MIWNIRNVRASGFHLSILFSLVLIAPTAHAATWICGDGNWNWNGGLSPSCWDWWDYPDAGEDVWIVDTVLYNVKTVTYVNPGHNPTLKTLYVNSNSTSGVGSSIYQAQDKLTATNVQIGADGWGAFEQQGGEHTVTDSLYLGHLSGSGGLYRLESSGNLSTGNTYVGFGGWGSFTQLDDTSKHDVSNSLFLGYKPGSSGDYDLHAGDLYTEDTYVGYRGDGDFTNYVGTHHIGNSLYLGYETGSDGSYLIGLSGSKLYIGEDLYIGYRGHGEFERRLGGLVEVTGYVYVGHDAGSEGYLISKSGGLFKAAQIHVGHASGGLGDFQLIGGSVSVVDEIIHGSGALTQTGGIQRISHGLIVHGGGAYEMSGGTLETGIEVVSENTSGTAIFLQTGGSHLVNELYLGRNAGGEGSYSLQGGDLQVDTEVLAVHGTAVFEQTSGAHTVTYNLDVGADDGAASCLIKGGSLEVGGTLMVGANGSTDISGGTVIASKVDMADSIYFNFNLGRLQVDDIHGYLLNSAGTLAAGRSLGLLTIDGDYQQRSLGTLEIELGGTSKGTEHDVVNVMGSLHLDGTLHVIWWDGYSPTFGDSFDILDWGSLFGTFNKLSLPGLPPGLGWNTSNLYVDGTLVVGEELPIFSDSFEGEPGSE